jgi:hypothetical protein
MLRSSAYERSMMSVARGGDRRVERAEYRGGPRVVAESQQRLVDLGRRARAADRHHPVVLADHRGELRRDDGVGLSVSALFA